MAIAYVTGTTARGTAGTASLTYPAGIVSGHMMVMSVCWKLSTSSAFTDPTGWTRVDRITGPGSTYQGISLVRLADGTESGTSITVNTGGASQQIDVAMAVYSGASSTLRANTIGGNGTTADTSVEVPDPGGNQAGDLRVIMGMVRGSVSGPVGSPSFTAPGGFSMRHQSTAQSGAAQNVGACIADGTTTGSVTITASASCWSIGATIWLQEAPAGGTVTPPTLTAEYESTWTTSAHLAAKQVSVTVAAGDVLVIVAGSEDEVFTLGTPTGGGLTYTLQQSDLSTDYGAVYIWTATSASAQTFNVSITMTQVGGTGTGLWGFTVYRFAGSDGIGASSEGRAASGAPSLSLTTTYANSAVVYFATDWNAIDATSRTWRTVNSITPTSGNSGERVYYRDSAHYVVHSAYWSDAGAAGAKTLGQSAPSGQKYNACAVEVRGTAVVTAAAHERLYLTANSASYTPATVRGAWDDTTSTLSRDLGKRPGGTATTVAKAETSATTDQDVLLGRWVSQPAIRAGTLSGNLSFVIGALESASGGAMVTHLHVFVTTGDTDVVRGTVLTDHIGSAGWPNTAAGVAGSGIAISSVAVEAGDHLVVEIGYRAVNAVTTSYTGTLNYGGSATTDLADAATAVTTNPGWIGLPSAKGIFWDLFGDVSDTFNDNSRDTVLWSGSYNTVSEVGGRARVEVGTGYSAYETARRFRFRETTVSWRLDTVPAVGTAASAYVIMSVDSLTDGTYAGWYYDAVAGQICARNAEAWWDANQVVLTYSSTTHKWLRIRETGGTTYWDTSTDGTTWTNRKNVATPEWTKYADLAWNCEGHRDVGAADFVEIDNWNTGPGFALTERSTADTVTVGDAVSALLVPGGRSISDAVTVADTVTRTRTGGRAVAEAVAAADAVARSALGFARSVAEAVTTGDGVTRAWAGSRPTGDTVTVADTVARTSARSRAVAEAVTAGDGVARAWAGSRPTGDTVTVADTVTSGRLTARATADTVALADSVARALLRTRATADTVVLADSVARAALALARTDTETVTVVDAVARALLRTRAVADTVVLADSVARTSARARAAGDTVTLADTVARAVVLARTLADAVTLADAASSGAMSSAAGADTVTVVDSVARAAARARAAGDTVTVADSLTRSRASARALADTVTVADAVARALLRTRTIADSVTVADVLVRAPITRARTIAQTVTVADTAARARASARAAADAVTLADAVLSGQLAVAAVADSVTVADAVARAVLRTRTIADGVVLVDAAARSRVSARALADAVQVADAATNGRLLTGTVADAVHLADTVVRSRVSARTVVDAVQAVDAAGRARHMARALADAVALVDTVVGGRLTIAVVADTVTVVDAVARAVAVARGLAELIDLTDAVAATMTLTPIRPSRTIVVAVESTDSVVPVGGGQIIVRIT